MVGAGKVRSDLVLDIFGRGGYLLVHLAADAWGAEEEFVGALAKGAVEDEEGANEAMTA